MISVPGSRPKIAPPTRVIRAAPAATARDGDVHEEEDERRLPGVARAVGLDGGLLALEIVEAEVLAEVEGEVGRDQCGHDDEQQEPRCSSRHRHPRS